MRLKYAYRITRLMRNCILLTGSILFWSGCTIFSNTDDISTLPIVVVGPFSGDLTELGQSMRNGILLATEQINAKGGVLGKQVKLSLFDTECDYTTARQVTQQAIRETGANYILGALCSEASEGVAQIASEEGVLLINPATVREGLTLDNDGEVRPLVFRIPFIDNNQGTAAALLALDTLNAKTAGVMVAETGIYESSLAETFIATFNENGGETLILETYDKNAESFYDVLSELREENVEIVYIPSYTEIINKIAAQARAFGMNQILIGSDGWHSPELNRIFLDGSYFTAHFSIDDPRPIVYEWVNNYENRYLVVPDTVSTLSFDAANILFSAIERSGKTTPYELAASIEEMEFDTVLGQIQFDEFHNPMKPVMILRILNGEIEFDSRINPHNERE